MTEDNEIEDLIEEEVDEIDTASLLASSREDAESAEPEEEQGFGFAETTESVSEELIGLSEEASSSEETDIDNEELVEELVEEVGFEFEDNTLADEDWDPEVTMPLMERLTTESQVEAVVFASPKPIKVAEIIQYLGNDELLPKDVQKCLDSLENYYSERGGGFSLENLGGGSYQFRSVAAAGPIMERMFSARPRALSRAAQETLAIVAYRQPVTRADIEFIRGVDAGSILKNLLERELVACVGRKEDSGRPMLFGTTEEFLRTYQINDLKDLPPLESFQPSADAVQGAEQTLEKLEKGIEVQSFVDDEDAVGSLEPAAETLQSPTELN